MIPSFFSRAPNRWRSRHGHATSDLEDATSTGNDIAIETEDSYSQSVEHDAATPTQESFWNMRNGEANHDIYAAADQADMRYYNYNYGTHTSAGFWTPRHRSLGGGGHPGLFASSPHSPNFNPDYARPFQTSHIPQMQQNNQRQHQGGERRTLLGLAGDNDSGSDAVREDEDGDRAPILPIFDSKKLDRIPVYRITHAIRLMVVDRVETTLSWDQLRTPQMSQFLVKPIQQQILEHEREVGDKNVHGLASFSAATLYALMANCLQFRKEGHLHPATVGISHTRAMVCELLSMRLLREYNPRELIDALSYEFDPFQGHSEVENSGTGPSFSHGHTTRTTRPTGSVPSRPLYRNTTRVSAVEVAIVAEAKRFIAHPVVVGHLEAIWAGNIVFHLAADSFHRAPVYQQQQEPHAQAQTQRRRSSQLQWPLHPHNSFGTFAGEGAGPTLSTKKSTSAPGIRVASVYSFADASLFKLSRLRVGRYRQFFSTLSFAIMLGLLTAILARRYVSVTWLEIVFWFFSSGFVLAEIAEFTEQGSGLFFMSYWNVFDLISEVLFLFYYALRIYALLVPVDAEVRRWAANAAYDVLAAAAVLLFPRLFSVLDHYYYFSQLLIALRAMMRDLFAVMLLILISCSGFLVAFTYSFRFGEEYHASNAIYAIFQLLMGFTPAAWGMWDDLNLLGKVVLVLFLFMSHFLIVTVLITVLTNSFMAVVRNAHEEHQYLFAINTISMVKTNALFSYIPPMNLLGWILAPLRYALPFRKFVKLNRQVIKVTHLPVLASIMVYERIFYSSQMSNLADPWSQWRHYPGIPKTRAIREAGGDLPFRSRGRAASVVTQQRDAALDAVFDGAYNGKEDFSRQYEHGRNCHYREPCPREVGEARPSSTPRRGDDDTVPENSRAKRKSTRVVDSWMRDISHADEPDAQSSIHSLARPTQCARRSAFYRNPSRTSVETGRSVHSEPDDFRVGYDIGCQSGNRPRNGAGKVGARPKALAGMRSAEMLARRGTLSKRGDLTGDVVFGMTDVDGEGDDEHATEDGDDIATIGPGRISKQETQVSITGHSANDHEAVVEGHSQVGSKEMNTAVQNLWEDQQKTIPPLTSAIIPSVWTDGAEFKLDGGTALGSFTGSRSHVRMTSTSTILHNPFVQVQARDSDEAETMTAAAVDEPGRVIPVQTLAGSRSGSGSGSGSGLWLIAKIDEADSLLKQNITENGGSSGLQQEPAVDARQPDPTPPPQYQTHTAPTDSHSDLAPQSKPHSSEPTLPLDFTHPHGQAPVLGNAQKSSPGISSSTSAKPQLSILSRKWSKDRTDKSKEKERKGRDGGKQRKAQPSRQSQQQQPAGKEDAKGSALGSAAKAVASTPSLQPLKLSSSSSNLLKKFNSGPNLLGATGGSGGALRLGGFPYLGQHQQRQFRGLPNLRRRSTTTLALDLASDLGDNRAGPMAGDTMATDTSGLDTHWMDVCNFGVGAAKRREQRQREWERDRQLEEVNDRIGALEGMLMEVLKEVKRLKE